MYQNNKVFAVFAAALTAATALLAVFLLVISVGAIRTFFVGDANPYPASISVEGKATEKFTPDIATFTFNVYEKAPEADAAQNAATAKIKAAVDFLKEQGVEEKDIDTASASINQEYTYPPCGPMSEGAYYGSCPEPIPDGFSASQSVTVKIRNLDNANTIWGGMTKFNLEYVGSLSKSFDNIDKLRDELRLKAIENANEKADGLADALGARIVRVSGYYENQGYPMDYGYGAEYSMKADGSDAYLPMGETELEVSVSVNYDIR